jgi:cation transport regulator ChaB
MPYASIDQLPDPVKNTLTENEQRQWMEVFNSVYAQAKEKDEKDPDIHAAKAAWSVVKKNEGIIVIEAEDGEHWITTPSGAHVLIGGEPTGDAGAKREKLLAYKKEKSAEYRAKAKQVLVGKEEPMHQVGDHYEATYKGTKFHVASDVENRDKFFADYKKEIDVMSPAQKAAFSNIRITNETMSYRTDGSVGTFGATYQTKQGGGEIKIYDANANPTSPHWYLAHESGHGVWEESKQVGWRGNEAVESARNSFGNATKEEGRISDYANECTKTTSGAAKMKTLQTQRNCLQTQTATLLSIMLTSILKHMNRGKT